MLFLYGRLMPKPKNVAELNTALLKIWNDLPHEVIAKSVMSFKKRLKECVKADGGHFEHLL
jgi:hypothetical protein